MPKITIVVQGGTVQAVYADLDVHVDILDYDNEPEAELPDDKLLCVY